MDQPRFAHTGLADDEAQLRLLQFERQPGLGFEHSELVNPADEPFAGLAMGTGRTKGLQRNPGVKWLLPTLGFQRTDRLVTHNVFGQPVRGLPNKDLSRLGQILEPAGGVHDVTHRRVVATCGGRSDQHLAGVDPDPNANGVAVLNRIGNRSINRTIH